MYCSSKEVSDIQKRDVIANCDVVPAARLLNLRKRDNYLLGYRSQF